MSVFEHIHTYKHTYIYIYGCVSFVRVPEMGPVTHRRSGWSGEVLHRSRAERDLKSAGLLPFELLAGTSVNPFKKRASSMSLAIR